MSTDSEQTGGKRGDDILVAEYVLGVLDATEHDRVAKMIADDPALQQVETFWLSRLSNLDENFEEVSAPSAAWRGIESRLFDTSAQSGAMAAFWDSLNFWRGLAVGAAAVAVMAIGFATVQPLTTSPAPQSTQLVASLSAEDSDVRYFALYDGDTGTVHLAGLSGNPVADRDFELWVIHPDEAPVSLGVVPVNARSEAILSNVDRAKVNDGTVFAVTLEPLGGAPEGIPTGPIVAAGTVTRI